jgi:hypothetical protein
MSSLNVKRISIKASPDHPDAIYIGRENRTYCLRQSPLANPYKIGKDGTREEVVKKYRQWLWEEIQKGRKRENEVWKELKSILNDIKQLDSEDDYTRLMCWCKEDEKCHGDVVINCLNWMNENTLGD